MTVSCIVFADASLTPIECKFEVAPRVGDTIVLDYDKPSLRVNEVVHIAEGAMDGEMTARLQVHASTKKV